MTKSLLPSEEIMETCLILTNPRLNNHGLVEGDKLQKAFQNYKPNNIEKYLSFITKMEAIKITQEPNSSELNLSNIQNLKIKHKKMNFFMTFLAIQINTKKAIPNHIQINNGDFLPKKS